MAKQKPKSKSGKNTKSKFGINTIITIAVITVLCSIGVYYAVTSMTPVNSTTPVFGAPANYYVKSVPTKNGGAAFVLSSTKGGKKSFTPTHQADISVSRGELIAIHVFNEDSQKHNLNLDEFNVHTKDLNYYEAESITIIADKTGKFTFYDKLHPEMTGTFTVR